MHTQVRTLVQNLRVGANWRSVIGPLARAVVAQRDGPRTLKVSVCVCACACVLVCVCVCARVCVCVCVCVLVGGSAFKKNLVTCRANIPRQRPNIK